MHVGRLDPEELVDRRHDVDRVDVLLARHRLRLAILAGHDTRHMSATPPSKPAQRFQYGNGVSNAHAQPGVVVVVRRRGAELVDVLERGSVVSATPLKNRHSLNVPFGPPSPLAPLSETTTMIVLSSWPDSSR